VQGYERSSAACTWPRTVRCDSRCELHQPRARCGRGDVHARMVLPRVISTLLERHLDRRGGADV